MIIRAVTAADTDALTAIYAHHVLNGVASFDTVPPDGAVMVARVDACRCNNWPFVVADDGGAVVGYANATQIRPRPAYVHTAEDSIYVRHDRVGEGIGRSLLAHLIELAPGAGFSQMIAVVGGADPASLALHNAFGFREAGRLTAVGFKFGRRLDTVYLQRA